MDKVHRISVDCNSEKNDKPLEAIKRWRYREKEKKSNMKTKVTMNMVMEKKTEQKPKKLRW